MKKFPFYFVLGLALTMFGTNSCSSTEEPTPLAPGGVDIEPILKTAKQGTWRVTNYSDHGGNETDHFTGYNFTFGENEVLTATNGTNTYTGTWKVTNNHHVQDESPDNPVDFNIFFAEPLFFNDISDDWDFVSRTDTKMELIDVSAEPGKKPDKLTFERN